MRPLSGVLVLLLLVAHTGYAQDPAAPTGEGRISGRTLNSTSQPIAGVTVLLGLNDTDDAFESQAWWVATSDQNGLYQFADLPSGRFILIAAKDGYVGWESTPTAAPAPMAARRAFPALALATRVPRLTLNLVPGGRASEVNVRLHRPASISGRAVGSGGSPAVDERMMLYTADETGAIKNTIGGLFTDADGGYVFRDLRPDTYYLGLFQTNRLQDIDRAALTSVTVTEGTSLRNIDVPITADRAFSIAGRVVDTLGQVPRSLQLEYGVPGASYRGLLSALGPDGHFQVRDRALVPGPLTVMVRGENDEGPVIGLVVLTTIDGPNDVEIVVGKPGGLRGRVSMDGGRPLTAVGARLALVREGFTPLGASDDVIEIAPDGWLDTGNLIGEYRVRVDEPQRWTVKTVRWRGTRVANDRLVIRNGEILDDVEILIGPR